MCCFMAGPTQRDQVLLFVVTQFTACADVVHFELGRESTNLATPSVALQNRLAECGIRLDIEAQWRAFGPKLRHDAFAILTRNCCLLGSGKSLNRRSKARSRASRGLRLPGAPPPGNPHRSSPDNSFSICPCRALILPSPGLARPPATGSCRPGRRSLTRIA